ncbi:MAG: FAD-binding oxidoreductase [Planctomycetota bacterium]|nr:MAG: FAD-binding oxidoreductase [Planctomycetota bacterium]
METADVVVVGCGVVGASVAYHLGRRGAGQKVLVLEREKAPCTGSTPLSAGGIRQQFSSEVNVRLSRLSVDFYTRMAEELGCDFEFEQRGYLFVTADEGTAARMRENASLQRRLGVPVEEVSAAEVARRWPYVRSDDLVLGTFCPTDGYADPYEATMGFWQAARRLPGVEFRFATPVVRIEHEGERVTHVVTQHGRIAAGWVVDCAGPWLREVGRMADLDLAAEPIRRCLWNTEPFAGIEGRIPLTIDVDSGFYTRSESGGLMLGLANPDEPPGFNFVVDDDWLPVVVEKGIDRIPCLAEAEVNRGWAGHYSTTPDHLPILCEVPWLRGFVSAGGFSGHGFMHAPATGLLVSEIILDGGARSVDIGALSIERFRGDAKLVPEATVI